MKKLNSFLHVWLVVTLFFLVSACRKNTDASGTTAPPGILPDPAVTASMQGRVIDENGNPVQGAAVSSGSATSTTDLNGIFTFSKISMSSRYGYVQVSKQGYFNGSRTILVNAAATNFVQIKLVPRTTIGSFTAAAGGSISVGTGNSVTFSGSSFVNASDNSPYSGTVHVYGAILAPTDSNTAFRMPGDLRGITTDSREVGLLSYGMICIELEGDGGQKLQIAPGKSAAVSIPIPSVMQVTAPSSVGLWSFSDSTGKWMAQGNAVKQGNNYTCQVSHFTWWGVGLGMPAYALKVRFVDQQGNAMPYTPVYVTGDSVYKFPWDAGMTDSSGVYQTMVLKGWSYEIMAKNACGTMLGGANAGPILGDWDLGVIKLTSYNMPLTITGAVTDCNSQPLAKGSVNVLLDGVTFSAPVTNGIYAVHANRCSNASTQAKVTAYDSTGLASQGVSVNVTTGVDSVAALSVCAGPPAGGPDQYVNFTIPGYPPVQMPVVSTGLFTCSGVGSALNLYATPNPGSYWPSAQFSLASMGPLTPGTYATSGNGQFELANGDIFTEQAIGSSVQVTVNTVGPNPGGYVTGTFAGKVSKDGLFFYAINGQFRLKWTR